MRRGRKLEAGDLRTRLENAWICGSVVLFEVCFSRCGNHSELKRGSEGLLEKPWQVFKLVLDIRGLLWDIWIEWDGPALLLNADVAVGRQKKCPSSVPINTIGPFIMERNKEKNVLSKKIIKFDIYSKATMCLGQHSLIGFLIASLTHSKLCLLKGFNPDKWLRKHLTCTLCNHYTTLLLISYTFIFALAVMRNGMHTWWWQQKKTNSHILLFIMKPVKALMSLSNRSKLSMCAHQVLFNYRKRPKVFIQPWREFVWLTALYFSFLFCINFHLSF